MSASTSLPRLKCVTGGPLRPSGGQAAAAVAAQPVTGRLAFPPHYYHTRRPDQSQPKTMGGGAPKRFGPKQTTYGYEMQPGMQPMPWKPRGGTRPRYDACTIRPDRGVSIREILAGAYFTRPMPEKYLEMLAEARTPAAVLEQRRREQARERRRQAAEAEKDAAATERTFGFAEEGGAGDGVGDDPALLSTLSATRTLARSSSAGRDLV